MKFETNNYELAKQDRESKDQNMQMNMTDLNMRATKKSDGDAAGADGEGEHAESTDIDEEMIREMCMFSNMSSSKMEKKEGGFAGVRKPAGRAHLNSGTKAITEEIDIELDGDFGTGGRPRIHDIVKLPPQYDAVDLNDPEEEVLFQGELGKYKTGLNPAFFNRWV